MSETIEKPQTVLEMIHAWSTDRPEWVRDALRRIVQDGSLSDDAIEEVYLMCKAANGLCQAKAPAPLDESHIKTAPGEGSQICVSKIENVSGVNQLAANQAVDFGSDGLTIIYGQNGSGKSGYTRILKRACNSRHRGEIMPDAFGDQTGAPAKATLSIIEDGTRKIISWADDQEQNPVLKAISVFDRDCAALNLTQKNSVLFRPFGLDIPDALAQTLTAIKVKLDDDKQLIEDGRDPLFDNPIWCSSSQIGKFLADLKHDSDPTKFETGQELSEDETARLATLQKDLNTNPENTARQYREQSTTVNQLAASLKSFASALSDEEMDKLSAAYKAASDARLASTAAAERAFGGLELSGVGEPIWLRLWEAARRYSEAQTNPERSFPPKEGEPCSLCQQPITDEASQRMSGFEEFIKQDTAAAAERAESELANLVEKLRQLRIEARFITSAKKLVAANNSNSAKLVARFMASLRLRRYSALRCISNSEDFAVPDLAEIPITQIGDVVSAISEHAKAIESSVDPDARKILVAEFNELNDRNQAPRLVTLAKLEIARLAKIKQLEAAISECNTRAITTLGNRIADEKITPAMRDKFTGEIIKLSADRVRVEIVRSGGRFGSPQYELRFLGNADAKIAKILSEGEQTCVALAAHLTELANDGSGSALVFDDPVTSLDHRWRRKVAERLVEESASRQIIVFTHDLVFVNDLDEIAFSKGLKTNTGSLSRTSEGCGVYAAELPWRAAKITQRLDKLGKDSRTARKLYEANEEDEYRVTVVKLYGELRAAWERALEDRVFAGVIIRHRDYLNTKNLKRVAALEAADVEEFDRNFKKCCDFLDAHDPSRARDAEVPAPDEVDADIQALQDWEATLKDKQNAIEKS